VRVLCVLLRSTARHRGGATAIEYALIAALVALTIVPTTATVGREMAGIVHNVGASIRGVPQVDVDPP
jgi:Flp pilus assembly pilin Flp